MSRLCCRAVEASSTSRNAASRDRLRRRSSNESTRREDAAPIAELMRELSRDHAVLLIEHDMDVVFDVAHQISVLHFGEVLETGVPEQIKKSQKVQEIYLGTGLGA